MSKTRKVARRRRLSRLDDRRAQAPARLLSPARSWWPPARRLPPLFVARRPTDPLQVVEYKQSSTIEPKSHARHSAIVCNYALYYKPPTQIASSSSHSLLRSSSAFYAHRRRRRRLVPCSCCCASFLLTPPIAIIPLLHQTFIAQFICFSFARIATSRLSAIMSINARALLCPNFGSARFRVSSRLQVQATKTRAQVKPRSTSIIVPYNLYAVNNKQHWNLGVDGYCWTRDERAISTCD